MCHYAANKFQSQCHKGWWPQTSWEHFWISQPNLCPVFCTILTAWSGVTFQGLKHAASGVGQQSSSLLQLCYSFSQLPRGSTCPPWRNLSFEMIQLFLQSQQVLNMCQNKFEWVWEVESNSWSKFYSQVETCSLSHYCQLLLLSLHLLNYLELPVPSAVHSPASLLEP